MRSDGVRDEPEYNSESGAILHNCRDMRCKTPAYHYTSALQMREKDIPFLILQRIIRSLSSYHAIVLHLLQHVDGLSIFGRELSPVYVFLYNGYYHKGRYFSQ